MSTSRALPAPAKAARAIERALAPLAAEDRLEALALALPQDDPTTRHARYRMALEAVIVVLDRSTYVSAEQAGRIAEKGLGRR
jgi:hypothetical protein